MTYTVIVRSDRLGEQFPIEVEADTRDEADAVAVQRVTQMRPEDGPWEAV